MRYANEVKVGVVFLLGLILIVFGYFFLRGLGVGAQQYYVKLNGAAQIAEGNEVRLQGVKIGQVQEVGFDPSDQKPILTLAVRRSNPPFKLLQNYDYVVQSSGIIGENYVDISGEYSPNALVYQPNAPSQIIQGTSSAGIAGIADDAGVVIQDLRGTITRLNTTLENINNGVLNQNNQRLLARTLDNVAQASGNANDAIGNASETLSLAESAINSAVGPDGVRVDLGDPAARRNLSLTIENFAQASRNVESASRDARALTATARRELGGVLQENRPQLRSLLTNFDRAATNVAGVTETLDFALRQGGFRENTASAFQSIRRAAENIEIATTGFRTLGEDPNTVSGITTTLTALRESTEALRDTARSIRTLVIDDATQASRFQPAFNNLNAAAQNLENVTEGLNNIVGEDSFQTDIKQSADNLNATLAATASAAERVNALLGGRRSRRTDGEAGNAQTEASRGASAFRTDGLSLTLRRHSDRLEGQSGQNFGDAQFATELFGAPFRIGLANIGDGSDFTLQTGRFIGDDIALRYGLYRSKLGVGAEVRKGRFSLEGNVYGLNDTSYNVYGGYGLTPNLDIIAGRESFEGDGTTSVGVRLRP